MLALTRFAKKENVYKKGKVLKKEINWTGSEILILTLTSFQNYIKFRLFSQIHFRDSSIKLSAFIYLKLMITINIIYFLAGNVTASIKCTAFKILILSRIYLYSSYFGLAGNEHGWCEAIKCIDSQVTFSQSTISLPIAALKTKETFWKMLLAYGNDMRLNS